MNRLKGKRVFVGLSGGVDSAVTALLLQQSGAQVTGVFIKGWYPPGMPCTWAADRRDAMRVAAHLRIPFTTLDASIEYKHSVIDYLVREYAAGRTPNPDIMCNRDIKFGTFYAYASAHGADYLATGHYAQAEHQPDHTCLLRGIDESKDQSYFLWAVPRNTLDRVLFPLGGLHKDHVRALARRHSLPVAQKKDSQGICFLGNIEVSQFLRNELGVMPGEAFDEAGTRIGTHDGAVLYTLGERVTIVGSAPGPWYVHAKDIRANTLRVGHAHPVSPNSSAYVLTQVNLLDAIAADETLFAQYRYHGPLLRGVFDSATSTFKPDEPPSELLAAGQSLVLYRNDRCVGGGIMTESCTHV